jgi:hypothetical protein
MMAARRAMKACGASTTALVPSDHGRLKPSCTLLRIPTDLGKRSGTLGHGGRAALLLGLGC